MAYNEWAFNVITSKRRDLDCYSNKDWLLLGYMYVCIHLISAEVYVKIDI